MGKLQPGTVVEFTYYGKVYHGKVSDSEIEEIYTNKKTAMDFMTSDQTELLTSCSI